MTFSWFIYFLHLLIYSISNTIAYELLEHNVREKKLGFNMVIKMICYLNSIDKESGCFLKCRSQQFYIFTLAAARKKISTFNWYRNINDSLWHEKGSGRDGKDKWNTNKSRCGVPWHFTNNFNTLCTCRLIPLFIYMNKDEWLMNTPHENSFTIDPKFFGV